MASYNKTSWVCSGVMIRPGLMLTNWHCGGVDPLKSDEYWNEIVIKDMFADISWDGDDISREYSGVKLVAHSEQLDYALIQMAPLDPSDTVLPLPIAEKDVAPGDNLILIHHTEGLPKQVSTCQVDHIAIGGETLIKEWEFPHSCDTEKGSSGSPVFNESGKLVGLHHFGFTLNSKCALVDKENKAIKISRIIDDLRLRYPQIYGTITK
jgi:hypothetical protein